jgi:hypothetical protein
MKIYNFPKKRYLKIRIICILQKKWLPTTILLQMMSGIPVDPKHRGHDLFAVNKIFIILHAQKVARFDGKSFRHPNIQTFLCTLSTHEICGKLFAHQYNYIIFT